MQSMDQELIRLAREGKVHAEEAYIKAVDKKLFESAVGPMGAPAGAAGATGATGATGLGAARAALEPSPLGR